MKKNKGSIGNLLVIIMFFTAIAGKAQDSCKTKQNDKCKVIIAANKIMNVEFIPETKSSNLLVILVDNFGNTVFLDSQHGLKGSYKRDIDLSRSAAGNYYLKIVSDNEIVNKKLNIQ